MLPGRERVGRRKAVPVIGSGDDHGVDVLLLQQSPMIAEQRRRLAPHPLQVLPPRLQHSAVDVGDRDALRPVDPEQRARVAPSHSVGADDPEVESVGRRHLPPT